MDDTVYSVLLVEDEITIREGIRDIIQWDDLGYRFSAEARNGQEALELFDSLAPDLVITDLHMPKMDGLTLISSIRERSKDVKIIILTGFDEFDYARTALQLNVRDYLLKPVAPMELTELLVQVKQELDLRAADQEALTGGEVRKHESQVLLRRMAMLKIISGIRDPDLVEAYLSGDPEIRDAAWFQVILFDYDEFHRSISPDSFRAAFRSINPPDIKSELIPDNSGMMIEIAYSNHPPDMNTMSVLVIKEKRNWISRELNESISTGLGSAVTGFKKIRDSYDTAKASLSKRYVRGGGADFDISRNPGPLEPEAKTEPILRFLKSVESRSYDEWETRLSEIVAELKITDASEESSLELMTLAISAMMNALKKHHVSPDLDELRDSSVISKVRTYKTLDALHVWVNGIVRELTKELSEPRQNSSLIVAENARRFIESKHMESSLSLEDVCSHLGVSASTFSRIFKTYLDTTFSNYLTEVRIRSAKKLISRTDLRNKEIAYQVGFNSPHYFSHVFTKSVGYSPTAFRKNIIMQLSEHSGVI